MPVCRHPGGAPRSLGQRAEGYSDIANIVANKVGDHLASEKGVTRKIGAGLDHKSA